MTTRLKAARRAMQQLFPLTEDLWVEWLSDEQSAAHSAEDILEVRRLYNLAVQDYLSLPIWQKFLRLIPGFSLVKTIDFDLI